MRVTSSMTYVLMSHAVRPFVRLADARPTIRPSEALRAFAPVWVVLSLAPSLAWTTSMRTADPHELAAWHESLVAGTALAPTQYRVLTSFVVEVTRRSFLWHAAERAFDVNLTDAYTLVFASCLFVTLPLFYAYVRVWLDHGEALFACAFLSVLACVGNAPGCIAVTDFGNLLAVVAALYYLRAGRDAHLLWIVPLAALNRESSLVIVLYFLAVRSQASGATRRRLGMAAALSFLWAAVYGGLHIFYGSRPMFCDLVMLKTNLRDPAAWTLATLFFVMPAVLAWRGKAESDPFLRRALMVAVPYLLLHCVIARVREVRLFLPLMPVVVPLVCCKLRRRAGALGCDGGATEALLAPRVGRAVVSTERP